jgi:hypothetical protein
MTPWEALENIQLRNIDSRWRPTQLEIAHEFNYNNFLLLSYVLAEHSQCRRIADETATPTDAAP